MLTTSDGRAVEWRIGGMLVPGWASHLEPQEVTLYGVTDDPMLVKLGDGRPLLLFRG